MYVLVVSKKAALKRLCVDSLVNRGHMAVGVSSFAEGERMLQKAQPDAIVICPTSTADESDIHQIRGHYRLKSTPILLISPERPSSEWISYWRIHSHIPYPIDAARLLEVLTPLAF